jgi:hypothetical protein
MWDDLPDNVAWLVRQLRSSGFEETQREPGTMDSGFIAFRRDPVEVRLVKDRSQWSVDLIADGWSERDRVAFRCSTASLSTRSGTAAQDEEGDATLLPSSQHG